jgi:hypothetical protein
VAALLPRPIWSQIPGNSAVVGAVRNA